MEIWQEIAEDGERGAERLVSEYGDRLYAAAVLLCGNSHDAEELVFRTFEQAIAKIRLYKPQWSFFTWLYTIMLNFRRMSRRRQRIDAVPMGAAGDLPERPCKAEVGETAADGVAAAVRSLSAPLREVVVLRYFADKSVEEIALALALPVGTVKSRLHNARTALAARLRADRDGTAKKKGEGR